MKLFLKLDKISLEGLCSQFIDCVTNKEITKDTAILLLGNLVDLDKVEPDNELEEMIFNTIDNIDLKGV